MFQKIFEPNNQERIPKNHTMNNKLKTFYTVKNKTGNNARVPAELCNFDPSSTTWAQLNFQHPNTAIHKSRLSKKLQTLVSNRKLRKQAYLAK